MTQDEALKVLYTADIFYYGEVNSEIAAIQAYTGEYWTPEVKQVMIEEVKTSQHVLNQNDVWGWACAMGEKVPDDKLVEVAELYKQYGWCGILYWVSEQNDHMKSEFHDINRMVEFVRHEEQIRKDYPDSSARAYAKIKYELGD